MVKREIRYEVVGVFGETEKVLGEISVNIADILEGLSKEHDIPIENLKLRETKDLDDY